MRESFWYFADVEMCLAWIKSCEVVHFSEKISFVLLLLLLLLLSLLLLLLYIYIVSEKCGKLFNNLIALSGLCAEICWRRVPVPGRWDLCAKSLYLEFTSFTSIYLGCFNPGCAGFWAQRSYAPPSIGCCNGRFVGRSRIDPVPSRRSGAAFDSLSGANWTCTWFFALAFSGAGHSLWAASGTALGFCGALQALRFFGFEAA